MTFEDYMHIQHPEANIPKQKHRDYNSVNGLEDEKILVTAQEAYIEQIRDILPEGVDKEQNYLDTFSYIDNWLKSRHEETLATSCHSNSSFSDDEKMALRSIHKTQEHLLPVSSTNQSNRPASNSPIDSKFMTSGGLDSDVMISSKSSVAIEGVPMVTSLKHSNGFKDTLGFPICNFEHRNNNRCSGHEFIDSYTDKLVHDVVKLTCFGGDSSLKSSSTSKRASPTKSQHLKLPTQKGRKFDKALNRPVDHSKHSESPHGLHIADLSLHSPASIQPVPRVCSPLTVSSGYESDADYMVTKEEEIDALFHNRTLNKKDNSELDNTIVKTLLHDRTPSKKQKKELVNTPQGNKGDNSPNTKAGVEVADNGQFLDEFVISSDELYFENHSSSCESTPNKSQSHLGNKDGRSPIKSDLNSPVKDRKAHQAKVASNSPIQPVRPSKGGLPITPSKSPSDRKLTKVAKSMHQIISDLGQIDASETSLIHKELKTGGQDKHSKSNSCQLVNDSPSRQATRKSKRSPAFLTSTPYQEPENKPRYNLLGSQVTQSPSKRHMLCLDSPSLINTSRDSEHTKSPISAQNKDLCPQSSSNGASYSDSFKAEGNQGKFEHRPKKSPASTSKGNMRQFGNGRNIKASNEGVIIHARTTPGDQFVTRDDRRQKSQMTMGNRHNRDQAIPSKPNPSLSTRDHCSLDKKMSSTDLKITNKENDCQNVEIRRSREEMFDEDYYLTPMTPRKLDFADLQIPLLSR